MPPKSTFKRGGTTFAPSLESTCDHEEFSPYVEKMLSLVVSRSIRRQHRLTPTFGFDRKAFVHEMEYYRLADVLRTLVGQEAACTCGRFDCTPQTLVHILFSISEFRGSLQPALLPVYPAWVASAAEHFLNTVKLTGKTECGRDEVNSTFELVSPSELISIKNKFTRIWEKMSTPTIPSDGNTRPKRATRSDKGVKRARGELDPIANTPIDYVNIPDIDLIL